MNTQIWLDNSIKLWQMGKLGLFVLFIVAVVLFISLINKFERLWKNARRVKIPSKIAEQLGLDEEENLFLQQLCLGQGQLALMLHDPRARGDLLFQAFCHQMEQEEDETKIDLIFRIQRKNLAHATLPTRVLSWRSWHKGQALAVSPVADFGQAIACHLSAHGENGEITCVCHVPPPWPSVNKLFLFYPHAGSGAVFVGQHCSLSQQQDRWLVQLKVGSFDGSLSAGQSWPPLSRRCNQVVVASFVQHLDNKTSLAAKEEIILRQISPETCTLLLRCPQENFQTMVLALYLEHEKQSYSVPLLPQSWHALLNTGEVDLSQPPHPADYRPLDQNAWQLVARIHPSVSLMVRNRISALTYQFHDRYYTRTHNKGTDLPRASLKTLNKRGGSEASKKE